MQTWPGAHNYRGSPFPFVTQSHTETRKFNDTYLQSD